MRPLTGDDASGRSRTSDPDPFATFRLPAGPQMTFTLGDESTIGPSSQAPTIPWRRAKEHKAGPHAEQHHEHSRSRIPHLDHERAKEPATTSRTSGSKVAPPDTFRQEDYDLSRPISPIPRSADTPNLSQPLTPVFLGGASGPASALSSVSSRRGSLCLSEDLSSCAPSMKDYEIAIEDDEEDENEKNGNDGQDGRDAEQQQQQQQQQQHGGGSTDERAASNTQSNDDETGGGGGGGGGGGDTSCEISRSMVDSGSAPQLVMPSIKMPSRRPFTEDGKRMGRLKVLIAGDSGVGKTSLIKAIVQSCEHIVHVDPITPSTALSSSVVVGRAGLTGATSTTAATAGVGSVRQKVGGRRQSIRESAQGPTTTTSTTTTTQITEIYASTKPYPEWWSEVDDPRVLQRRKRLGDSVLDRNLCFVDTPGYGSGSSSMDTITPVSQYIESHLQRISSNSLSDGDLLNLLGGEGGVQVDVVFYMVSNRIRPVDIEYLRQISPFTNIIVLLGQADLMSAEQIAASKAQIHGQLKEADIRLFSFSVPSSSTDTDKQGVYAISSATGTDHDTMDASLLMSPDYVQPLAPSELGALVADVFSPDGVARLRHAVARKYVQWRASSGQSRPSSSSLFSNASLSRHSQGGGITPSSPLSLSLLRTSSETGASNSFALARLADHTQREERLAQVRLANWAADLQRSLAREREEYANLARRERALWLAERMGECVREGELGSLVVSDRSRSSRLGAATTAVDGGNNSNKDEEEREGRTRTPRRQLRRVIAGQEEQHSRHHSRSHRHHSHHRCQRRQLLQLQQQQKRQQQRSSQRHKQDPLGLLEVAADLRHRSLIALELLGGIGVLGGLAIWVTKNYLLHLQPYEWLAAEWERFWYGSR